MGRSNVTAADENGLLLTRKGTPLDLGRQGQEERSVGLRDVMVVL